MTNEQAWELYLDGVHVPEIFKRWGFLYLCSAALQRRVWLSNAESAIFPNLFVVLCGPAGLGKSQVTLPVKNILLSPTRQLVDGRGDVRHTPLFYIAADSTTFESLVTETARANSFHQMSDPKEKPYLHNSISFVLDEYCSIFKMYSDDLKTFLLQAFNCGRYLRATKKHGNETIDAMCVGLLAGTTPNQVQRIIKLGIVDDGLAARTIFVHSNEEPDHNEPLFPPKTPAQEAAKLQLVKKIARLHTLYGECSYTPEAYTRLSVWWKSNIRVNHNALLDRYYARRILHCHKLAMTLHFSEEFKSRVIGLDTVEKSIEILEDTERNMHYPLIGGGRNELAQIGVDIVEYVRIHPMCSRVDLLIQFDNVIQLHELDNLLISLQTQHKIVAADGTGFDPRFLVVKKSN